MDGQDLDVFRPEPVDQTIVPKNDFSNIPIVQLRQNPASLRELGQPVGRIERSLGENCRELRRITGNEKTDRFQSL